jgi:hypothetical protein
VRLIAFVTDQMGIGRILDHLGLSSSEAAKPPPAAREVLCVAAARELYERALASERNWAALREIYLKLADLAYLAGDPATEPRLREHYFGILRE